MPNPNVLFPVSLDNTSDINTGWRDKQDDPSALFNPLDITTIYTRDVIDLRDAILELEAKVGSDGSTVTTSFDYRINTLESSIISLSTQTDTNETTLLTHIVDTDLHNNLAYIIANGSSISPDPLTQSITFSVGSGLTLTTPTPNAVQVAITPGTIITAHSLLTGLNGDDHTQYLTTTRHNAITGNPHNTTIADLGGVATINSIAAVNSNIELTSDGTIAFNYPAPGQIEIKLASSSFVGQLATHINLLDPTDKHRAYQIDLNATTYPYTVLSPAGISINPSSVEDWFIKLDAILNEHLNINTAPAHQAQKLNANYNAVNYIATATESIRNHLTAIDTKLGTINDKIPENIGTTKGDLIAFQTANTPVRVAVGVDQQVLIADSTTSSGVSWASAGTPIGGIIPWVKPTPSSSIPSGWAICNGTTLGSQSGGPYGPFSAGYVTPNLTNRLVKGIVLPSETVATNDTTIDSPGSVDFKTADIAYIMRFR